MALVNWGDSHQDFRVDLGRSGATGTPPYHVVDFWRGEYRRVETEWIDAAGVPPHGVRLVAVRPLRDAPQWVGDTLHISQGLGVERWSVMGSHIEADLALGHRGDGTAFLSLPAAPVGVTLDDSPVAWRSVAEGVYALEVSPSARSVLRVSWG